MSFLKWDEVAIEQQQEIAQLKARVEELKKDCACDNCFYGRRQLAEELLRLRSLLLRSLLNDSR